MAIKRYVVAHNPETGEYERTGEVTVEHEGRVVHTYSRNDGNFDTGYGTAWCTAWCAIVINSKGQPKEEVLYTDEPRDVHRKSRNVEYTIDGDSWAILAWENHKLGLEIAAREAYEKRMKEHQEIERNRPEKGKKMEVYRGRKVPVGTVGVVAYIHANGGVLLKPEHEWQDREANGVWVDARNLRGVSA